jgi:hypothetical protein
VEADGERFRHGGLRHRDRLGNRHRLFGPNGQALPKATLRVREPHGASDEVHIQAFVPHALAAVPAMATGSARVDGDPRAGRDRRNIRPDLDHRSGDLMPEHHGLADADRAEAAVVEVVHVGAADPAGLDCDPDLPGTGSDGWDRLDAQVLRRVNDDTKRW